jgi:hypothetical protein
MSLSLTLACLWLVAANVIALLPSRDNHWSWAYLLIALGLPILGFVFWQHGPWVALVVMVAAMSLLRWPVVYLWRWVRRQIE